MRTEELIAALDQAAHANQAGDKPLADLLHLTMSRIRELRFAANVFSQRATEQMRLIEQVALQYPDVAGSEPYQSCVYRHHSARQSTRHIEL